MSAVVTGSVRNRSAAERRALDAYVKLHRAVSSVQGRSNTFFAQHGLTPSQFATLEVLYHKGPLCQRDIATRILRSGGNLTVVIDNLEKGGLVRRRVSESDRREKVVELTPSGRALIAEIFPTHATRIRSIMGLLTEAEQEELARLCRKLGRGVAGS